MYNDLVYRFLMPEVINYLAKERGNAYVVICNSKFKEINTRFESGDMESIRLHICSDEFQQELHCAEKVRGHVRIGLSSHNAMTLSIMIRADC